MNWIKNKRLQTILCSFWTKPGYTIMRMFARFSIIRYLVSQTLCWITPLKLGKKSATLNTQPNTTIFRDVKVDSIVADLKKHGAAFGLKLPMHVVNAIRNYASNSVCYADRDSKAGFKLQDSSLAENIMGKKILVAQYFNTTTKCPEIDMLAKDPVLNQIARTYLRSDPKFVGANLWWTFPVEATKEDRDRHAHLFHRDVDDFKFLKFFFYITDVSAGDGAHVCVLGSQGNPPIRHVFDRWNLRRYSDEEIRKQYLNEQIREICGKAGDGFVEDTWCIHKGQTPVKMPRLLLQIQFSLFDYGVMHDRRDDRKLQMLT